MNKFKQLEDKLNSLISEQLLTINVAEKNNHLYANLFIATPSDHMDNFPIYSAKLQDGDVPVNAVLRHYSHKTLTTAPQWASMILTPKSRQCLQSQTT